MPSDYHWEVFFKNPKRDLDRSKSDRFTQGHVLRDLEGKDPPHPLPHGQCTGILSPKEADVACLTLLTPHLTEPVNTEADYYPWLSNGLPAELTVTGGFELSRFTAAISATDRLGNELTFFDPSYAVNQSLYECGKQILFALAALGIETEEADEAVETARGPLHAAGSDVGKQAPFGFVEYLNGSEYRFQGIVSDARRASTFSRCRPMTRYQLRCGCSLETTLYVPAGTDGQPPLRDGTVIRGRLWLQGIPQRLLVNPESREIQTPSLPTGPDRKQSWISSQDLDPHLPALCLGKRVVAHALKCAGWKIRALPNPLFSGDIPDLLGESPSGGLRIGLAIRTGIAGIQKRIPFSEHDKKHLRWLAKNDYRIPLIFFPEVELKPVQSGFQVVLIDTDRLEKRVPELPSVQWIRMEGKGRIPRVEPIRWQHRSLRQTEGVRDAPHLWHLCIHRQDLQPFSEILAETVILESEPHHCQLQGKQAVQEQLGRIVPRFHGPDTILRSRFNPGVMQLEQISRKSRQSMEISFQTDEGWIAGIIIRKCNTSSK